MPETCYMVYMTHMDHLTYMVYLTYMTYMTYISSRGAQTRRAPEASPSIMRLSQDFGNIFTNGKFTDCSITCEGREFRCHQNILAARSSVFDAMFTHNMEEKISSRVDIIDLDSETVQDMITYIYSGKVGELDGKATGLLSAAEKYDLRELKQLCEDSLCNNINTDNVLGKINIIIICNSISKY